MKKIAIYKSRLAVSLSAWPICTCAYLNVIHCNDFVELAMFNHLVQFAVTLTLYQSLFPFWLPLRWPMIVPHPPRSSFLRRSSFMNCMAVMQQTCSTVCGTGSHSELTALFWLCAPVMWFCARYSTCSSCEAYGDFGFNGMCCVPYFSQMLISSAKLSPPPSAHAKFTDVYWYDT